MMTGVRITRAREQLAEALTALQDHSLRLEGAIDGDCAALDRVSNLSTLAAVVESKRAALYVELASLATLETAVKELT